MFGVAQSAYQLVCLQLLFTSWKGSWNAVSNLLLHEFVLLVGVVPFSVVFIRHDILVDLAGVFKPASCRLGVDVCVNDMQNAPVQHSQLQRIAHILSQCC